MRIDRQFVLKSKTVFCICLLVATFASSVAAQAEGNCLLAPGYVLSGQARAAWAYDVEQNSFAKLPIKTSSRRQETPPTGNIANFDWLYREVIDRYFMSGGDLVTIFIVDDFNAMNFKGITHGELVRQMFNNMGITDTSSPVNEVEVPISFATNLTGDVLDAIDRALSESSTGVSVLNLSFAIVPCQRDVAEIYFASDYQESARQAQDELGLPSLVVSDFYEQIGNPDDLTTNFFTYRESLKLPESMFSVLYKTFDPQSPDMYLQPDLTEMLLSQGLFEDFFNIANLDWSSDPQGASNTLRNGEHVPLLSALNRQVSRHFFFDPTLINDPLYSYLTSLENVYTIAAAGNDGYNQPYAPAAWDGVFAVSASLYDENNLYSNTSEWTNLAGDATYSNMGDVMVPGAWYELSGTYWSGTSLAAPVMSFLTGLDLTNRNDGDCILQLFYLGHMIGNKPLLEALASQCTAAF